MFNLEKYKDQFNIGERILIQALSCALFTLVDHPQRITPKYKDGLECVFYVENSALEYTIEIFNLNLDADVLRVEFHRLYKHVT